MVEVYVGTSGWMYDWNEEGTFDWYAKHSGLNAVELNASFYRFPFRNQVIGWSRKGSDLKWSIKVHRSITHYSRMASRALDTWWKFYDLFKPLDERIDFYLFQLPPSYTCSESNLERIAAFNGEASLNERMAVEFRNSGCFKESVVEWAAKNSITVVSIDAPIATWIARSTDAVYLRMHGREAWYGHDYGDEELAEIARRTIEAEPKRIYVFFNNDHWMLENARAMRKLLSALIGVEAR